MSLTALNDPELAGKTRSDPAGGAVVAGFPASDQLFGADQ